MEAKKWVDSRFPERYHCWVFVVKVEVKAQLYNFFWDREQYIKWCIISNLNNPGLQVQSDGLSWFLTRSSESESHSVVSNSLGPHRLYSPWNSPGQNTGVGSRSLLQGIVPTKRSNPGLPHCGQILYQLSHKGSPRILEWVAYSFSSGSFWPRNWTGVSFIASRFFTNWAIREVH